MKKYLVCFFFLGMIRISSLPGQEKVSALECKGYLSEMNMSMFSNIDSSWMTENLIHSRLNLKWYATGSLNFAAEIRTRFMYGDFVESYPGYASLIDQKTGWMDLSGILISGNSYLLHTTLDRLWMNYSRGNLEIRIGRQRINWGLNYAWNPNDIFNTYSFFEFDYPERPGSDAVRIQYYTGVSSLLEAAVKVNANEDITAAVKWSLNAWGYDFQFLGGILDSEDLVAGFGWSGNVAGAGFRGECSYFRPFSGFKDSTGILIFSTGLDILFSNSLYLQTEILYNGAGNFTEGLDSYFYSSLSVKTISFTDWSILAGLSYPLTPLFQGSLNAMWFPSLHGYYAGPSLSYSMAENLQFDLSFQHFAGEFDATGNSSTKQKLSLLYLRLKASF